MQPIAATKEQRFITYLIDVIPAFFVSILFGWIPILGAILVGMILGSYWLLRDVTGGSLGKLALGLRVRSRDGSEAGVGSRILRNLPIAFGPALLILPLIGYVLAPTIAFLLIITETIMLLTQGERLGDRLAGTGVFRLDSLSDQISTTAATPRPVS